VRVYLGLAEPNAAGASTLGQQRHAVQLGCLRRRCWGVVEDGDTARGQLGGAHGLAQAPGPTVERGDAERLELDRLLKIRFPCRALPVFWQQVGGVEGFSALDDVRRGGGWVLAAPDRANGVLEVAFVLDRVAAVGQALPSLASSSRASAV